MRIIFTNKLSKMVAHYKIYLKDSEAESVLYHGQDLLAEKTLRVTLNDISSRNEV